MTIIRVLQNKMEIIHLRPLSQAEIAGHTSHTIFETFIDDITTATFPPARLRHVGSELSHVINAGGYPPALLRTSSKRRAQIHSASVSYSTMAMRYCLSESNYMRFR